MQPTSLLLALVLVQAPPPPAAVQDFPAAEMAFASREQSGLAKQDARRRLAEAPDDPATVRALIVNEYVEEALGCLERIVADHPDRIEEAFRNVGFGTKISDGAHDYLARFAALIDKARDRITTLPRDQRAAAEYQLLLMDSVAHPARRRDWPVIQAQFIKDYGGTPAGIFARIFAAQNVSYPERLRALDQIAADHPGSVAAAQALYEKGFQLANNAPVAGPDVQRDPTERFIAVTQIVKELESGRYPSCEWVTRAPSLVIEFNAFRPAYAPGNVDRMLEAYLEFVKAHLRIDPMNPISNGIGYVVVHKMGELFSLKGDKDGVDRTLAELEGLAPDADAIRYARAMARPADIRERLLQPIAEQRGGLYARKALATLAADAMAARRYDRARDLYREYITRYPESGYTWLAALRLFEADAALGDWAAAAAAVAPAVRDTGSGFGPVLGREYAARAYDALDNPARALDERAAALAAWDDDFGSDYPTNRLERVNPNGALVVPPRLQKVDLAARVAEMRDTLAAPGGALLERGRWLMERQDFDAAVPVFEKLIAGFPRSRIAPHARELRHRAQLERALGLANVERPGADAAAAHAALDALADEPIDPAVIAARIARASIAWSSGEADAARAEMGAALNDWHATQPQRTPASDIERDVQSIREAVFLPQGGGIYAYARGWNAFEWPSMLPRYLVVAADTQVRLASGEIVQVSISRPLPRLSNVLFADREQIALLSTVLESIGGTKKGVPPSVMATPNQPIGESRHILQLWNEFFPCRPGHWMGWEFVSYPQIDRIEFLDADRTRAAVAVTVGYSGATIVMEKSSGAWHAVKLTNQWIT